MNIGYPDIDNKNTKYNRRQEFYLDRNITYYYTRYTNRIFLLARSSTK